MNMHKFILFFLLLSSQALAQSHSYFQACFSSNTNAKKALEEVKFIKNKADRIKQVNRCLEFYTETSREELYQKFLLIKFQGQYRLSSSTQPSSRQCKLELIKVSKGQHEKDQISLGQRNNLHSRQRNSNQTSAMSIYISEGTTGSMMINSEKLTIHCRVNHSGYELEIAATSPELSLKTSRFLPFGQSIELGDFIQKIDNKKSKLSSQQGIEYSKADANKYSSIKLRAKQ